MNSAEFVMLLFTMGLVIVFGWLIPIVCGILVYQHKGYSGHWMWFGLHPVGGYIALLVGVVLRKRQRCPDCGGFVQSNFWLCPYCGFELIRRRRPSFGERFEIELPEKLPPASLPPPQTDQGAFTDKGPHPPEMEL